MGGVLFVCLIVFLHMFWVPGEVKRVGRPADQLAEAGFVLCDAVCLLLIVVYIYMLVIRWHTYTIN